MITRLNIFFDFHLGHFEKWPLWVLHKGQIRGIFFGDTRHVVEHVCKVSACSEFFPTNAGSGASTPGLQDYQPA